MSAEFLQIWPYLIAAPAVFMIDRRFRRSFGRQPVRPVLIGYWVCYYGCVLWKSKHLRAEDPQAPSGEAAKFDGAR